MFAAGCRVVSPDSIPLSSDECTLVGGPCLGYAYVNQSLKDPSMATPTLERKTFQHRFNYDGTFDSICLSCFQTIATTNDECVLSVFEEAHACADIDLYRVEAWHEKTAKVLLRTGR